ncbi:hypothetical protein [Microbacterium lacticum]|uniref:Uncharacterized protein n=1 Tax=Microbacterium lacticum TaxID=33885 RepID=A0A4Y3UIE1_9MICO|nr:hypothetical protein [Microbacterium lacticum]TQN00342.1 hypothetical protein FHX68_0420 [Microbacterium lacticum]GEB94711.1 hypothetical protein MLA01_09300 [Microbacterium lacticum]GGN19321.1 hypothetical protein GCM10009724_11610 [Microbacterium lacticum]
MSTPEKPESPQLTRRQLRELRNTASNTIITPEEAEAAAAAAATAAPVAAPLPRAAEPVVVAEEPPAAEDVDLESRALTRRAARQQERLRTVSVPVIDGETDETAGEASVDEASAVEDEQATVDASAEATGDDAAAVEDEVAVDDETPADEPADDEVVAEVVELEVVDVEPVAADVEADESTDDAAADVDAPVPDVDSDDATEAAEALADAQTESPDVETLLAGDTDEAEAETEEAEDGDEERRAVVAPTFGSGLLAGDGVEIELPASFDQLLTRGSAATGSLAASNALILSQTPDTGSFSAPVAATGEVLITGTFNLPESFGSTGTSHGSSDGKEIDAVLVDGELPASSSPTPIAASSAISTIKSADDIIKPPAPEKGGRLMLALVITAGALALALTGALIVALVTGVFR